MKAELKIVEWRVTRKSGEDVIEYMSALLVDGVPIPTKEPIIVTRRLTPAQSELLSLLLQEEKGEA